MNFTLNEYHRNVSDEELLNDILRVAHDLNQSTITIDEYNNGGGKYNQSTIIRRFGGWIKTLQQCGLSPRNNQANVLGVNETLLVQDLQRVADKLGKRTFTGTDYSIYGKYSRKTYHRCFGSWNKALENAGLVPFDHPLGGGNKNKVDEYKCVEEIERLWVELGRQPTTKDIKKGLSKYSLHVYERRFGSWRKALEFFVAYMNGECEIEKPGDSEAKQSFPIVISGDNPNKTEKPLHKTQRDIGLKTRFLVMKRDSFKCCMCGRSPATTPGLELHIDHIVPWSKGGETTIDNLQTLCSDCNLGKSNLLEDR